MKPVSNTNLDDFLVEILLLRINDKENAVQGGVEACKRVSKKIDEVAKMMEVIEYTHKVSKGVITMPVQWVDIRTQIISRS